MKSNKKNISQIFLVIMLHITLLPILLLGYLWISQEYKRFSEEAQTLRARYSERQKRRVKNQVDSVLQYIEYNRSRAAERLKQDIKGRVNEACLIAENIYQRNKSDKSLSKIKQLIIAALDPIRFNDGKGYYFAIDLDGIAQFLPGDEALENTCLLDIHDSDHRYFIRDALRIIKTRGEGFYQYRWHKPGSSRNDHLKIAYARHFEPLNWMIVTAAYFEDVRNDIEREVMGYIGSIRFGEDNQGYVFVYNILDFNGGDAFAVMRVNPNRPDLVGQKISDNVTDADGRFFRKTFMKGIREQGEVFVRYRYKKFDDTRARPKISYFKLDPKWNYVIAAGVYLDHLDPFIQQKHQLLRQSVNRQVGHILLITLGLILTIIFIAIYAAGTIKHNFRILLNFCDKAAIDSEPIDTDCLVTRDFEQLAQAANQMLSKQQKAQKALQESSRELEHKVEQRTAELMQTNRQLQTQIEERRRTEKMLRLEKDNMKHILDTMKNGVCIIDRHHTIQYANPEIEKTFGPLNGKKCYEYFLKSKAPVKTGVSDILSHDNTLEVEWCAPDSGKTYRIISTPFKNSDGTLSNLKIFHDITRIKTLQKELLCNERLATTGRLAASIAHEINSPLQGVTSLLHAMQVTARKDEEQSHNLALLNQAFDNIKNIARKLMDLNRPVSQEPQPVDVNAIIRNTASLVGTYLRKNRIHLKLDLCPTAPIVNGVSQVIGQVFINLLNNAVEAIRETASTEEKQTAAGPRPFDTICVNTRLRNNEVWVEVSDTGPGIPADSCARIFEPFYTTKTSNGMGIGLAICQGIIHDHDGTIEVAEAPEGGALFTIRLPLIDTGDDTSPLPD